MEEMNCGSGLDVKQAKSYHSTACAGKCLRLRSWEPETTNDQVEEETRKTKMRRKLVKL